MVFARNEDTFYALQKEMQNAAASLGYDQVLEEDLRNATAQNELRAEAVALLSE